MVTRSRTRCRTRAVLAAVAITATLAAAAPACAAASTQPAARLTAVSCTSSSWCMAVGSYTDRSNVRHALAQAWNGTSWQVMRPPGSSLRQVSCSAPWFCMAAGGPTGAETWNGSAWRSITAPQGGLTDLSCGSRKLCMNGRSDSVQAWNGTSWRQVRSGVCSGEPAGPCGLSAISCGSALNCVAVGTITISQEPVTTSLGLDWNGTAWSRTSPPSDGNPAGMNAISCARAFCLAAGGGWQEVKNGAVAVAGGYDATSRTWTDVSPSLGVLCSLLLTVCYWSGPLSCASATSCMDFSNHGHLWWNGTTWRPAPSVSAGPGSALTTVSCGGTRCVAVGYRTIAGAQHTLAERWDGTAWTILSTPAVG